MPVHVRAMHYPSLLGMATVPVNSLTFKSLLCLAWRVPLKQGPPLTFLCEPQVWGGGGLGGRRGAEQLWINAINGTVTRGRENW